MTSLQTFKRKIPLLGLIVLAFALRVYQLAGVPLRWDEGWSIGLSSLPLGEINRITALDVHPPLYYYWLKPWLVLGEEEFYLRFSSVIFGTLTVPLTYVTGCAWSDRRTALMSTIYVTVAPPLVYYAQVTRMFAATAALVLLAVYGLLRFMKRRQGRQALLLILGGTAALYSFYYAGFIVAALFLYALLAFPRRWKETILSFVAIAILYLPWVAYAAGPMLARVGQRTRFSLTVASLPGLMRAAFVDLVFSYGSGRLAVYAVLAVLGLGVLSGFRSEPRTRLQARVRALSLPALAILLTLAGAAVGAQAHMFAPRYTIGASPFLALFLGWALASLWSRSRLLLVLGLVALLSTTAPSAGFVYSKTAEVFDPFDPAADWRVLHERATSNDTTFFNVLSLAGTYQRYRTVDDPAWSYALRWDPVVEPLDAALSRVRRVGRSHRRLWFVLFKGAVAANRDLKEWLDRSLYPAWGRWHEDTLYLLYLAPDRRLKAMDVQGATFGGTITVERVAFTPRAERGGQVAALVSWRAENDISADYKVFVHLYDTAGKLVAQHDSIPVNGSRPTPSWVAGERVEDRHGLLIPEGAPSLLRLFVGLYDPETGQRLTLPDGGDRVELGRVELVSSD